MELFKAVSFFLTDAILKSAVMKSSTATTKVFCKSGNYKDALKDFKKLKPSNVSRRKVVSFIYFILYTL